MSVKWVVQTGPLALVPAGLLVFAPITGSGEQPRRGIVE